MIETNSSGQSPVLYCYADYRLYMPDNRIRSHFSQDRNGKVDSISVANLKSLICDESDIQIVNVRIKKDLDKTKVIPYAQW